MVLMELVGTIRGDGFLGVKYFYQYSEYKTLRIYESCFEIPRPNECDKCKFGNEVNK